MPLVLKKFGNKSGNPAFFRMGPPAGGSARGHSDTSFARPIVVRGARIREGHKTKKNKMKAAEVPSPMQNEVPYK